MDNSRILASAMAGTTAMSAYSYIVSEATGNNFREPRLLADMLFRIVPFRRRSVAQWCGWILHYGVGFFFAAVYRMLLRRFLKTNVLTGLMIGGATGVFGVIVWKGTLMVHPHPPQVNKERFFGHLIIAHIIFGAVTIYILDNTRLNSLNTGMLCKKAS